MSGFRHFLYFVGRRRVFFCNFCISSADDELYFSFFIVFCSSGSPETRFSSLFRDSARKVRAEIIFHAAERLCEIMIRALISYGTNGEPVRPKVSLLRGHLARGEAQVVTVARVVARACRPIVAEVAHAEQRTVFAVAITRSREIYGGIRTADFVIEVETGLPSTVYIEL